MKKPIVINKSYLRDNLAEVTNSVVNDKNNVVWLFDNKKDAVGLALVNADSYDKLQRKVEWLQKKLFEYQTKKSFEGAKIKENTDTFNNIEDLMSDLNDDQ